MLDGIIVDNFAGGGGASTGIETALGQLIDVAINHDAQAIAMQRLTIPIRIIFASQSGVPTHATFAKAGRSLWLGFPQIANISAKRRVVSR